MVRSLTVIGSSLTLIWLFIAGCTLILKPLDTVTTVDAGPDADLDAFHPVDAEATNDADDDDSAVSDSDPDLPEADLDQPIETDVPPDADESIGLCGDGHVDPGEECDDGSFFWETCARSTPDGWFECTAGDGSVYRFHIDTTAGAISWGGALARCRDQILATGVEGWSLVGLAIAGDLDVWSCLEARLDTNWGYWIGLRQRDSGAEPSGGWYWMAETPVGLIEVESFDMSHP